MSTAPRTPSSLRNGTHCASPISSPASARVSPSPSTPDSAGLLTPSPPLAFTKSGEVTPTAGRKFPVRDHDAEGGSPTPPRRPSSPLDFFPTQLLRRNSGATLTRTRTLPTRPQPRPGAPGPSPTSQLSTSATILPGRTMPTATPRPSFVLPRDIPLSNDIAEELHVEKGMAYGWEDDPSIPLPLPLPLPPALPAAPVSFPSGPAADSSARTPSSATAAHAHLYPQHPHTRLNSFRGIGMADTKVRLATWSSAMRDRAFPELVEGRRRREAVGREQQERHRQDMPRSPGHAPRPGPGAGQGSVEVGGSDGGSSDRIGGAVSGSNTGGLSGKHTAAAAPKEGRRLQRREHHGSTKDVQHAREKLDRKVFYHAPFSGSVGRNSRPSSRDSAVSQLQSSGAPMMPRRGIGERSVSLGAAALLSRTRETTGGTIMHDPSASLHAAATRGDSEESMTDPRNDDARPHTTRNGADDTSFPIDTPTTTSSSLLLLSSTPSPLIPRSSTDNSAQDEPAHAQRSPPGRYAPSITSSHSTGSRRDRVMGLIIHDSEPSGGCATPSPPKTFVKPSVHDVLPFAAGRPFSAWDLPSGAACVTSVSNSELETALADAAQADMAMDERQLGLGQIVRDRSGSVRSDQHRALQEPARRNNQSSRSKAEEAGRWVDLPRSRSARSRKRVWASPGHESVVYKVGWEREVLDGEALLHDTLADTLADQLIVDEEPTTVLDIGTGTGLWPVSQALQWRSARFVGLDIVPSQIDLEALARADATVRERTGQGADTLGIWEDVAHRITWDRADSLGTLPYDTGVFSLVHLRFLALGIPESAWPDLLEEAIRVLAPGGILSIEEMSVALPASAPPSLRNSFASVLLTDMINPNPSLPIRFALPTMCGLSRYVPSPSRSAPEDGASNSTADASAAPDTAAGTSLVGGGRRRAASQSQSRVQGQGRGQGQGGVATPYFEAHWTDRHGPTAVLREASLGWIRSALEYKGTGLMRRPRPRPAPEPKPQRGSSDHGGGGSGRYDHDRSVSGASASTNLGGTCTGTSMSTTSLIAQVKNELAWWGRGDRRWYFPEPDGTAAYTSSEGGGGGRRGKIPLRNDRPDVRSPPTATATPTAAAAATAIATATVTSPGQSRKDRLASGAALSVHVEVAVAGNSGLHTDEPRGKVSGSGSGPGAETNGGTDTEGEEVSFWVWLGRKKGVP